MTDPSPGPYDADTVTNRAAVLADRTDESGDGLLIVVIGPCASGKTTLVNGLRSHGYRAMVVGQEHSEIPSLWRRADPDVAIGLTVDLATVRQRRSAGWSESIFRRQLDRLQEAFAQADLILDTTKLDPEQTLATVVALLQERQLPR